MFRKCRGTLSWYSVEGKMYRYNVIINENDALEYKCFHEILMCDDRVSLRTLNYRQNSVRFMIVK